MMHFWDPHYCYLTFETIKLAPTIELYSKLFWPNVESPKQVYAPDLDSEPHKNLASLLNIRVVKVKEIFIGDKKKPVTVDFLMRYIDKCWRDDQIRFKFVFFFGSL